MMSSASDFWRNEKSWLRFSMVVANACTTSGGGTNAALPPEADANSQSAPELMPCLFADGC